MKYQRELINAYYSTHYKYLMPETESEWNWVLGRLEKNFGDIISNLSKDSRILDVACGVGFLEQYLIMNMFNNVDAIDLSEDQLRVAKNKLIERGMEDSGFTFEVAEAFSFVEKASGYDLIVAIDLLEHFSRDEVIDFLKLARNALSEGGLLMIRTSNADNPMFARFFYRDFTHVTPFTLDSLRQCLELSGFKIERLAYEKVPILNGGNPEYVLRLKHRARLSGQWILGKFLGIQPEAFAEELIAVARKEKSYSSALNNISNAGA